ncbi:MAG: hypothetical protein NUV63_06555 [Gallionella sp.]|nr:hypothetical protein [Gallionella sp.]
MTTPLNIPPSHDQLEISLFGHGFGESIVAHLGNGNWIIVDSCVSAKDNIPKALGYLNQISVDSSTSVRLVVASHWHDDHVAGLSDTLEACTNAAFCCPVALGRTEFLELAELYSKAPTAIPPGPSEIYSALQIAARRSKKYKRSLLSYAKSDSMIWASQDRSAIVYALSPSDEMVHRSLNFMTRSYAIAKLGSKILDRLTPNDPNDVATALRLDINGRSILLGSDLESGGNSLVGWRAVLTSVVGPSAKSVVYKVAHHGAKSGHHDKVWSDLLHADPVAIITPFRWGAHRLPTADDRSKILGLTNNCYITSNPKVDPLPPPKRQSKVEAIIQLTTKSRRSLVGTIGHIRWRSPLNDLSNPGDVELFDGALRLAEVD